MKRSKFLITCLGIISLITSCQVNNNLSSSNLSSLESSLTSSSTSSTPERENPNEGVFQKYFNQAYASSCSCLPSIGNPKLLVVPVVFNDYSPTSSTPLSSSTLEEFTSDLQDAFFGETEDTYYESVSSYYYKSSYGKLDIQGEVSDVFYTNHDLSYYVSASNRNQDSTYSSDLIYQEVYQKLFLDENHPYDANDYDYDNNGVVDAIHLVYYYPDLAYTMYGNSWPEELSYKEYYQDSQMFLWAYVYWIGANPYSQISYIPETMSAAYCWSSYFFLKEGGYSKVDAHTQIHETGHLLGLDDLYANDNTGSPTGLNIMMDNNIGDQDPLSKYNLDWINPYCYDFNTNFEGETVTIELKPFETSGDCILISPKLNDTCLNEYILVEYYTPTNLNKQDAETLYYNQIPGVNASGIKMYYVNQGIVEYANNNIVVPDRNDNNSYYVNEDISAKLSQADENKFYNMLSSNALSSSYNSERIIRVLSSLGESRSNQFLRNNIQTAFVEDDLFLAGDSFNNVFPNFKFNNQLKDDPKTMPCDIQIDSIDENKAVITLQF